MIPAMNPTTILVVFAMVVPVAAGDNGDDFSNNLFTDLAPYAFSATRKPVRCILTDLQAVVALWGAVFEAIHELVEYVAAS